MQCDNLYIPNTWTVICTQVQGQGSYKTVNLITQETFEKITPQTPRALNPEKPPPPPSVVVDEDGDDATDGNIEVSYSIINVWTTLHKDTC